MRCENFKFAEESSVAFEERVAERAARTGLSQALIDAHLDDEDTDFSPEMLEDETEMSDDEFSVALIDAAAPIEHEEADVLTAKIEISGDHITDMFKKTGVLPQAKGGPRQTWSPKFIQFAVELLSGGETAASAFNFFSMQAKYYPEVLGKGKEVPSVNWFERLRDCLPFLNSMHTKDVITKAGKLFLAADGAAMNDCSKSMAVGVLQENGKLHLLDIQKSEGGTGEAIASQMMSIIDGTGLARILGSKIECLMTDQEAAQRKANFIVAEQLCREDNEERPKMIGCNMHSVANCCKNSREALKNVNPDAFTLLEDIKCVFGKPPEGGFVQQDGRTELQLLLKELDGTKTRIFSHDLGKNSFVLLLFQVFIKESDLEMTVVTVALLFDTSKPS